MVAAKKTQSGATYYQYPIYDHRGTVMKVVDENGAFSIDGVPPGTYVLKSWHGRLGEQEMEIEVAADGTVDVSFAY